VSVGSLEYWAELFARHGFYRDVDFEAQHLSAWTVRLRKTVEPAPRIAAAYERTLGRHRTRVAELTGVINVLRAQSDERGELAAEVGRLRDDVTSLAKSLRETQTLLVDTEHDLRESRHELTRVRASVTRRLILSI